MTLPMPALSLSPARKFLAEWLLLLAALTILGISVGYTLLADIRESEAKERGQLTTHAKVIHDSIVRQLDAINLALASNVRDYDALLDRQSDQARLNRRLTILTDAMPAVRTMTILDATGAVLASNRPELIGSNFRSREYFQTIRQNPNRDTLYISPPFKTSLGVWAINVARMIPGPHGEFAGVASATLDPDEFRNTLDSVRYAPDMWVSLVHGDGKLFMTMPEHPEHQGANLAKPDSLFSRHLASGQAVTVFADTVRLTSEKRIMVQHTLQPAALNMYKPLVIAISRRLDAILNPWHEEARLFSALFVLLAAGTAAGLFLSQRRRREADARIAESAVALREKSEELERFFSVSLDLLCIADMQGHFRKLNPAWENVLGYPLQELEGTRFIDLVHPDDVEATLAVMGDLRSGNVCTHFINRYRTHSGEYRLIEWHATPFENRLIYAAARDITQQRRNEQALADSERFMRSLIDIISGMVGYWTRDLRCGFANIAYNEWFGKTPEQMRGIRMQDLMGAELFGRNEPFVRAALRGERQRFERTLIKADGSTGYTWAHYIPDVVDAQVRGFFVLISDITDLKKTEIALRAALTDAERFREALDHVSSYIYLKDLQHCYVYANRPTLELFGVSAEELIGSPDERFFPPETVQRLREVDDRVFRGERTGEEIEVLGKNGERRIYWEIKTPIYADAERETAWGLCGISTDITERKQGEQELERARTAAEAANRAKSAFLANMSHEIRTPMNAVLGLLQLLQMTELNARQTDYAQKAQTAAEALLGILNDILDFSKVEAGKLVLENQPFRLDELLRNLGVVLSTAMQDKEIEVLFDVDPEAPRTLRGDSLRLQQVLLNLAGNAIKFTTHGEVVLSLRCSSLTATRVRIEFSVRDTGIGIAPDRLAAIFEGFTQAETSTTRNYGGTGLGLAISQRLVTQMGGELQVDSTPGQGSCFRFTLEFARDDEGQRIGQETLSNASNLAPDKPASTLRALIVDDNTVARELLAHMATSLGWEAATAASGAEAIELLRREGSAGRAFDAIFVDWRMPGMDGWEAVQHIRALPQEKGVPLIIMVTAHDRARLAEHIALGGDPLDGFLVKPVTPSMLFDAVAEATKGRSVTREARAKNQPRTYPLAGLRLLVVEDNPTNQQVAQELLTHEGAWVQVANDGLQGIARIREAQPPFDAVLMDLQMPNMDGFAATHVIRHELGLTMLPIIAMTANALPADREACLDAGMNDHVGKPIHIHVLVTTVLRHCRSAPTADDRSPALDGGAVPPTPDSVQLPDLPPGFALAEALERLDQNRLLFVDLIRQFTLDHREVVQQVRHLLRQGDRQGAARTLHTLKGVAGTLGAQALARQAAEMEGSIKAGTRLDENDALLVDLQNHLTEALHTLQRVAVAFRLQQSEDSAAPADPIRLHEHLDTLENLLCENNMRALDVYTALKCEFGDALGEQLAALDEAMNRLDFAAAREKLHNLNAQFE